MTALALSYVAQGFVGVLCLWLAWCLWRDDDRTSTTLIGVVSDE